jgi:hypothetical protein
VLGVSGHYYQHAIGLSLILNDIPYYKVGRYGYKRCLEIIIEEEINLNARSQNALELSFEQYDDRNYSKVADCKNDNNEESMDDILMQAKQRALQLEYEASLNKDNSTFGRMKTSFLDYWYFCFPLKQHFQPDQDAGMVEEVFWLSNPRLYFRMVSLALFLQCLYVAIWAAHILPLCAHSSSGGGWGFVFTLLVLLNYYLIGHLVTKAVILRSLCAIDYDVMGEVCEEVFEEKEVIRKIHDKIHMKMIENNVTDSDRKSFICKLFAYNKDYNNLTTRMNRVEFRLFLSALDIYLATRTFNIFWKCIDTDLSDNITWD